MQTRETQFETFVPCIVDYCNQQFPRACSCCEHEFQSFRSFLLETVPVGAPMSYDDDEPVGVFSFANCRCGSTLAIECGDVESPNYLPFTTALQQDAATLDTPLSDVLSALRAAIRAAVLGHDA